jgi:hypothetical protein
MSVILNRTPFAFMPVTDTADPAERMVTFVVKATFTIVPNAEAVVAKAQRPILPDTPHMDEIGRSLAWPNDMVPWKPNTGFFIIGSFHQPGGEPATTGRAGFMFGPLRKELLFFGPRVATQVADGSWTVVAEEPMLSVPLRWEYSYGGLKDRRNPYGMGQEVERANGIRTVRLPRIEHPEQPLRTVQDRSEPANFAPMPPSFQKWSLFRAPLLPLDWDPSFFNAAPEDQQAGDYPRGDETVTLANLHPKHPRLSFRLPGLQVRVAVLRQTAAGLLAEEVPMVIDTVVPMPDEDQLVLLFRGRAPLQGTDWEAELPWVSCSMHRLDEAAPDPGAALLAEANKGAAAAAATAAAEAAQVQAEIAKLLPKANLPPELEALVKSGANPEAAFDALGAHLEGLLAALSAELPPGA